MTQEIASDGHDNCPKVLALLTGTHVIRMVIEHRHRLSRFGAHDLEKLLAARRRRGRSKS